MEEYKPKIYLQIGGKDTGKSRFSSEFINLMYQSQGIPCLVLDIAGQDIYADFKRVELDDIPYFRPTGNRPFYRCETTDVETFVFLVNKYVRNCLIVLEDVTPHFAKSISRNKEDFIFGTRNKGLDVLFNTHNIGLTSSVVWYQTDILILRKTPEPFGKLPDKTRVPDVVEKARKQIHAENERKPVYNEYGRRVYPAYRIIDLDSGVILS